MNKKNLNKIAGSGFTGVGRLFYKKVWLSGVFFAFFLGIVIRAEASEPIPAETVRVGYMEHGEMVHKEGSNFTGYGVEYLNTIAQYTGWKYEYVLVTEEDRMQELEDGSIDILCNVSKEEGQKHGLILSAENSGLIFGVLYAKKNNDTVFFDDYAGMDGKTVAIDTNKDMRYLLEEYASDHQISFTILEFTNFAETVAAVEEGQADLLLTTNLRKLNDYKYVAKVGVQEQYFATSPSGEDLMTSLDFADRQIKLNAPFWIARLYEKYYGRPSETLTGITRQEYEFITSEKKIRVACDVNNYPIGYIDETTGEIKGILVDDLNLISAQSGLQFEFIPVEDASRAPEMLARGEVEVIAGLYMDASQAADYNLLCSNAFWYADYTVITRTDQLSMPERPRIAISNSHLGIYYYLTANYPDWELVTFDSVDACMEAVERSEADVTIVNSVFLQTIYSLSAHDQLTIMPGQNITVPMCSGIGGPDAMTLQTIFDKAIFQIPEEDFERCAIANTIHTSYQPSTRELIRKFLPFLLGFVIFLVVIFMILLRLRERKFHYLAMTDLITGLGNGMKFRKDANIMLERRKQKELCIISLDMERFKYVNNDFGEKAADDVLQVMGKRLRNQFGADAICARDMADMFLILTEYNEDVDEKIESLSEEIVFESSGMEQRYRPVIKCGICRIPFGKQGGEQGEIHSGSLAEYIDYAVTARKSIKGLAGHSIAYYNREMADDISNERKIEKRMESALRQREFVVYYQPKYHLKSETIIGAEALVRWIDPEEGLIPPMRFIPIFERNGFIVQLDFYVYEEVLKVLAKWRDEGRTPIVVSVNVSRVHIGTTDFLEKLTALSDRYGVPRELLELELTETVLGGKRHEILEFISSCKKAGFQISIDDFGSGYSSLNLLKELPVDVLKIDREFLNETEESQKSSIIVEQVVEMATRISIRTLCEGVETRNQAEFLRQIGCDMAQGYLYSKPVPIQDFEKMLGV